MEDIQSKAQKLIDLNIQALKLEFREIKSSFEDFIHAKDMIAYVPSSIKNAFTDQKKLQQKHLEIIGEYKMKVMNISKKKSDLKCANDKLELLLGSLRVKENELDSLKSTYKNNVNFSAKYDFMMKEFHDNITLKKQEIEDYKKLIKKKNYDAGKKKEKIFNLSEQKKGLIVKVNYLKEKLYKKRAEFERLLKKFI